MSAKTSKAMDAKIRREMSRFTDEVKGQLDLFVTTYRGERGDKEKAKDYRENSRLGLITGYAQLIVLFNLAGAPKPVKGKKLPVLEAIKEAITARLGESGDDSKAIAAEVKRRVETTNKLRFCVTRSPAKGDGRKQLGKVLRDMSDSDEVRNYLWDKCEFQSQKKILDFVGGNSATSDSKPHELIAKYAIKKVGGSDLQAVADALESALDKIKGEIEAKAKTEYHREKKRDQKRSGPVRGKQKTTRTSQPPRGAARKTTAKKRQVAQKKAA